MICSVTKEDFPHLLKVLETMVEDISDFLKEDDFEFFKKYRMSYYFERLYFFAYTDQKGKVKGFLGVSEEKVEMLFIGTEFRGSGVAKKLMDFVIKNLKITKVDVSETNKTAVSFFNHLGFKVVGRSETDNEGKNYPILHLEK